MADDLSYDIREISAHIVEWADTVFPDRTPEGTIKKMIEELQELTNNPMDAWEMADVFILILDLCNMLGFDLAKITRHKMRVNKSRNWMTVDGVMHHVEDNENTRCVKVTDSETVDDSAHDQGTELGGTLVQCDDDSNGDMQEVEYSGCRCYKGSSCSRQRGNIDRRHSVPIQKTCGIPLYGPERFVRSKL